MNSVDKKPDYKKIYSIVCDIYKKTGDFSYGPHDETFYSMRVYESAKEIMSRLDEPINKEIVLVSALLHDVGKSTLDYDFMFGEAHFDTSKTNEDRGAQIRAHWQSHPKCSVPLASDILKELGHSGEFISQACFLIGMHDQRGNKMNPEDRTIELKVLQDADLIADIGYAGFIRPILYGAKFKRPVIGTFEFMKKYGVDKRSLEDGSINLGVSKELVEKNIKLLEGFIDEFVPLIKTDLFDNFSDVFK